MFRNRPLARTLLTAAATIVLSTMAHADHLLNLKVGEPFPAFKLPTITQTTLDSEEMKGSVMVLVCLSAEQRSSELAALDARDVVHGLAGESVKLGLITSDIIQKPYFEKFRQERSLDAPLAFDSDRVLYKQLGLIVFPTTIVVGKDGKLAHVLALHGGDYPRQLDAYTRHALGKLTDEQLAEALKAKAAPEGSPKSMASAHRARARVAHEKGELTLAREELAKARELDPSNADIQLDIADIDLASDKVADADQLVIGVLQVQPDHRRAKQLKGIVLFRQNKLAEAETVLLEALNLNPDPNRVHYYLGRVYEAQGKPAKALEHYREGLGRVLKEPEQPAAH